MCSVSLSSPAEKFSVVALDNEARQGAEDLMHFVEQVRQGHPALEFFTSGSTGQPKKITFDTRQILLAAEASIAALGLEALEGALVCPLPARTVAARMMAVRAWLLGRPLWVLQPALRPELEKVPPKPLAQVILSPAQCQALLDNGLANFLASAGNILLGGSPVPPQLEDALQHLKISSFITYGMTETLGHVALRRPGQQEYLALNTHIRFDTDTGGRIIIETPWLSAPLLTNDVGQVLDRHTLRWLGRVDFVINCGGVKIHPEEVERLLTPHMPPEVAWFVGPAPDERFGTVPALYVEGHVPPLHWSELWEKALPEKLWRPRKVVALHHFCRSPEGKFLRGPTLQAFGTLIWQS